MSQSITVAPEIRALILAHYTRTAPYLTESFSMVPIVWTYYPDGFDKDVKYAGQWHGEMPRTLRAVEVGDRNVFAEASAPLKHQRFAGVRHSS